MVSGSRQAPPLAVEVGEDEVIAQGVMYYFQKKYWDVNGHRIEDGEITPTDRMPQWLIDIIQADIDSRS